MAALKRAFDPAGILGRGNMFAESSAELARYSYVESLQCRVLGSLQRKHSPQRRRERRGGAEKRWCVPDLNKRIRSSHAGSYRRGNSGSSSLRPRVYLESAYQECLCQELALRGIPFEYEVPSCRWNIAAFRLEAGYRVGSSCCWPVVVEVKAIEAIAPIHEAQLLTYLRLGGWKVGLLMNFNVVVLKDGIRTKSSGPESNNSALPLRSLRLCGELCLNIAIMFRFTTAGESHGRALVAIVEGLPAGLPIDVEQINHELWRRQQGYGRGARMKIEQDRVEILSGVRHGLTLGSPLALLIENKDWANWNDDDGRRADARSPREIASRETAAARPCRSRRRVEIRRARSAQRARARFGARDGGAGCLWRVSQAVARTASACEIRSHVIQLGGIPEKPLELTFEQIAAIPEDAPLNCADAAGAAADDGIDRSKESAGDTLGRHL